MILRWILFDIIVAGVAEQEAVLIQELADGGDIPAAVHDGELGLCQIPDRVEDTSVAQVFPTLYQHTQVLGDEQCWSRF